MNQMFAGGVESHSSGIYFSTAYRLTSIYPQIFSAPRWGHRPSLTLNFTLDFQVSSSLVEKEESPPVAKKKTYKFTLL